MMMLAELVPGDLIHQGDMSAVYVTRSVHPIWPGLMLVIWRLEDEGWSFDALKNNQDVGDPVPSTAHERKERLRHALLA
jgi:hypothetical protein